MGFASDRLATGPHKRSLIVGFVFVAVMLTGVVPQFFLTTEFNAPYYFAFKFITIPLLAVSYAFAFRFREAFFSLLNARKIRYRKPTLILVVFPILITALLVLAAGGFVAAANVLLGSQEAIVLNGTIKTKFLSGGRSATYVLILNPSSLGREVELPVSRETFKSKEIGSSFETKVRRGGLGIIYQWK